MKHQFNLPDCTDSNTIRESISFTRVTYVSEGYYSMYFQCSTACVATVSTVSQIYASYTCSGRLLNKVFSVVQGNKLHSNFEEISQM